MTPKTPWRKILEVIVNRRWHSEVIEAWLDGLDKPDMDQLISRLTVLTHSGHTSTTHITRVREFNDLCIARGFPRSGDDTPWRVLFTPPTEKLR